MKLSYNWIREYLETNLSPGEMARILTDIGLEVENTEPFESVRGGLEGVVIGEVRSCKKHPNADKLSLTEVDVGQGRLLPIVCGAPNVAAGQKVPVALPGTMIYKGEESFEIKKTSIRGETSEGMICAEDELGLGADHTGIMVLDPAAPVGHPAREYFGVYSDTVFEIGLTPNRIDGGSHFGAARDLAAYFSIREGAQLKKPSVVSFRPDNHQLPIPVRIEAPEACPRYTGVTLSGIKVSSSPAWLQNRLRSIGLSPINNVVDITNFVLHETGQPLHAFDADRIDGKTVVVRKMPAGTSFTTLDGEERTLHEDDLMICNNREAMCIGGVFGGLHSGVTEETVNVFLESAYFDPVSIRKTARRHGLNTDASFHFERGADPAMTLYALKRAALLIREIAGGTISSDIVDEYPVKIPDHRVELSYAQADRLIGKHIEPKTIKTLLQALDIEILEESPEGVKTKVPAYRVDVTREADLIEEILRHYGYNSVEIPDTVHSSLSYAEKPDPEQVRNKLADLLAASGYAEIMANSLTRQSYYHQSQTYPEKRCVLLQNPLSQDLNAMRQVLLFGGLEAIQYNQNRQQPDLRLFEFGSVYALHDSGKTGKDLDPYQQEERLGIWITGDREPESWHGAAGPSGFFSLKSIVEKVLERLGIRLEQLDENEVENDLFGEGLVYAFHEQVLLEAGSVAASLLKAMDIRGPVFHADLRWDVLLNLYKTQKIVFRSLPKFPEVRRDLALVLDKQIKYSRLRDLAYQAETRLLKKVNLFDYYEGKQVEAGKKSYAISFILQDPEKTLTDKQIDQVMAKLLRRFEQELGAKIR